MDSDFGLQGERYSHTQKLRRPRSNLETSGKRSIIAPGWRLPSLNQPEKSKYAEGARSLTPTHLDRRRKSVEILNESDGTDTSSKRANARQLPDTSSGVVRDMCGPSGCTTSSEGLKEPFEVSNLKPASHIVPSPPGGRDALSPSKPQRQHRLASLGSRPSNFPRELRATPPAKAEGFGRSPRRRQC